MPGDGGLVALHYGFDLPVYRNPIRGRVKRYNQESAI
jgi:hypothetical protein